MSNAEPSFTGGGSVFGWLVAQWRTFLGSKVDALNGYSTNQTLTTPTINGFPVPSSFPTAVTAPLALSMGTISLDVAATFAVVGGNLDYANESANFVLAGPTTGAAAKPTFRALVAGDIPSSIGVSTFNGRAGVVAPTGTDYSSFMRSYLAGLILSNDGTTPNSVLDISAGSANDSTNAITMQLGAFTKSTAGAWVAGSGNHAMGNGLTIAATTWYHVFLIVNSGTVDVYFDTSPTAANAPSSTTAFRRIGSFKTDSSAHVVTFSQNGDEFIWTATSADINASVGTTAQLYVLLGVPTGVKVNALFRAILTGTQAGLLNSPDENAIAGGSLGNNLNMNTNNTFTQASQLNVRTNTSAQIRGVATSTGGQLIIFTYGWIDTRGRDS